MTGTLRHLDLHPTSQHTPYNPRISLDNRRDRPTFQPRKSLENRDVEQGQVDSDGSNLSQSLSDHERNLMGEWCRVCTLRANMHELVATTYAWGNSVFIVPSIVLGSTSGILALLPNTDCDRSSHIAGVLSITASIFTSLANTLALSELSARHQEFSQEYQRLQLEIDSERMLQTGDNPTFANTCELLKNMRARLDRIILMSPVLPRWVEYLYRDAA